MKNATYTLVFNKTNSKMGIEDKALLQICACLQRKRKYFSTGIHLTEKQWNKSKAKVINHPNEIIYNRYLKDEISKMEDFEYDTRKYEQEFSIL